MMKYFDKYGITLVMIIIIILFILQLNSCCKGGNNHRCESENNQQSTVNYKYNTGDWVFSKYDDKKMLIVEVGHHDMYKVKYRNDEWQKSTRFYSTPFDYGWVDENEIYQ